MKTITLLGLAVLAATCVSLPAYADCSVPNNPGVVICFPSPNSTLSFPMKIEAAATARNGLPITDMVLYANNQRIDQVQNANTLTFTDTTNSYNGTYHLVLNAWDSDGNLYQAATTVTQIDANYPCSHPASGINFCAPPNGSYQPSDDLQLVAYGSSNVTSMNAWLNGSLIYSQPGNTIDAISGSTVSNNWQTFTVKAYQGSTPVYTASSNFKLYYAYQCSRNGCSAGIVIQQPTENQDTNSPFTVAADVENNPHEIRAMKVYLDGQVVATSTGPTIRSQVTANAGSHLLSVQAWDTTGALYKTDQNVNIN